MRIQSLVVQLQVDEAISDDQGEKFEILSGTADRILSEMGYIANGMRAYLKLPNGTFIEGELRCSIVGNHKLDFIRLRKSTPTVNVISKRVPSRSPART